MDAELERKIIYLLGFWLEGLLYGVYFCLYVAMLGVSFPCRRDAERPRAANIFLAGNTLMFILISIHNILNCYRLVVGFAYQIDARAAITFLDNLHNWATYSLPILLSMIVWIGDALVIYRCFLIWEHRFWVVALPILLFVLTIGSQTANFWYTRNQNGGVRRIPGQRRWPFFDLTFPLYFTQNFLTTGLIIWKIWSQSRGSQAAGLAPPLNTPRLTSVMRIIVESASVYTASMLVMVVLRALVHPGRILLHCVLVPTIGITFTLMAFRLHALRENAKFIPADASFLPPWLSGGGVDTSTTSYVAELHEPPFGVASQAGGRGGLS